MSNSSRLPATERGSDRARLASLIGVGLIALAGLALWVALPGGRSGEGIQVEDPFDGARLVSPEGVVETAGTVGHPVFWAGRLPGFEVAMDHDSRSNVHVRYLPDGVDPETGSDSYLTVGSYPFQGAFEATARLAGEPGRLEIDPPGGVGFLDQMGGNRIVLAFRSHPDLQVEVFDPRTERALAAVRSGSIVPIP